MIKSPKLCVLKDNKIKYVEELVRNKENNAEQRFNIIPRVAVNMEQFANR